LFLDAYDTILKDGLDFRVANLGGSIGAGIYFGIHSSTSNGYVVANGHYKKMLYCRVTLGDVGPGQSGLRRPPEKYQGSGILYDSVGSPNVMYVIFDNHQSYPEYVIHYSDSHHNHNNNYYVPPKSFGKPWIKKRH
jgi:poly [ADP-ribose] polymerase 7/11/12/13